MAILTVADQPTFFPDLNLAGDALLGAIAMAQAIAEGPLGANRRLERHKQVDTLRVLGGLCYLSAGPLAEDAIISVKLRTTPSGINTWGRSYGTGNQQTQAYQLLPSDRYSLDIETKELLLDGSFGAQHSPLDQASVSTARIEYYVGHDFTSLFPTTAVLAMKSALAGMLKSAAFRQSGLESFSLTDFYRIDFVADAGSEIEGSLAVFRNFK